MRGELVEDGGLLRLGLPRLGVILVVEGHRVRLLISLGHELRDHVLEDPDVRLDATVIG